MKCPNCHKQASGEHFRDHPECIPAVKSLNAMVNVSKRKDSTKGGRPKKFAPNS